MQAGDAPDSVWFLVTAQARQRSLSSFSLLGRSRGLGVPLSRKTSLKGLEVATGEGAELQQIEKVNWLQVRCKSAGYATFFAAKHFLSTNGITHR